MSQITPSLIRLLAPLANHPISHGDICATVVIPAADGAISPPTASKSESKNNTIAFRLSIPSIWIPPEYDADGFTGDIFNPYDRKLLLPSGQNRANVNLLDIIEYPGHIDTAGRVRMTRRAEFSPAGRDILMSVGNDVVRFAQKVVLCAAQNGATFYLKEAVIEDYQGFRIGAKCPVILEFALSQSK